MNPNQNPNPNSEPDNDGEKEVHNPFAVMQPGEQVVCEIKRHPIGLLGIYLVSALVVIIALAVAALVPTLMPDASAQVKLGVILGAMIAIVITLLYAYVGSIIYNGNRWIVTSDSITEVAQRGLFTKQTSQLSLANLEDVTADQPGFLASIIGYGTLHVETAGEHSKFIFPYCPNPNEYARKIIAVHEAYIAEKPHETYVTNRPLANSKGFNQPRFGDQNNQPPQQQS